jgi:hypothetical protein
MQPIPNNGVINLPFGFGFGYPSGGRPDLWVEFAAVDALGQFVGQTATTCLLDSGADRTMLHVAYAAALGLDVTTMPEVDVGGVGPDAVKCREYTILSRLCGKWIVTPVWFTKHDVNVIGRAGVFQELHLAFLHANAVVLGGIAPLAPAP